MAVTARQTVSTLRQRSQALREAQRARAQRIRDAVVGVVRSQLDGGARAWLIASLAGGDFGERSDVDLVLDQVSSERATQLELALVREVRVEVDLLRLDELPGSFRQRVLDSELAIHDE